MVSAAGSEEGDIGPTTTVAPPANRGKLKVVTHLRMWRNWQTR